MKPLTEKELVQRFWEEHPCGEGYAHGDSIRERLEAQARARYALEPYIPEFARFAEAEGRDVLEIGVGLGADHAEWAKADPRTLSGIDLTSQGIAYTRIRFDLCNLRSRLLVADAETLPFASESLDIVYSWGVLHHTPRTEDAVREVARVLRPGGMARIMIYHRYSLVGAMLWFRYALLAGRPWRTLDHLYARYLESPGTKAYSARQAKRMFRDFSEVRVTPRLSFADLLLGDVGGQHRGLFLDVARRIWPRRLIRWVAPRCGLMLLIDAVK